MLAASKRPRFQQTGEALEASRVRDPNPEPAGALHTFDQQDAPTLDNARPVEIMDSVLPFDVEPSTFSDAWPMAETLASNILASRDVPTRDDIASLFDLLPHKAPPRGMPEKGAAFTCGAFAQGPLFGLHVGSRKYPKVCRLLASFVRSLEPGFIFTTISLFLNVRTHVHVDSRNDHRPNLVAGISDFTGGEIVVESPGGAASFSGGDSVGGARKLPVSGTHVTFEAYKLKHETAPWVGNRLVLVAFSVPGVTRLCKGDVAVLEDQGFQLPEHDETSTNRPPTLLEPKSDLSKTTSKLQGCTLRDIKFVELFCGTGGVCAAMKKQGFGHCLGIAPRVTGHTLCPVLPLDLRVASQQSLMWDVLSRKGVLAVHICPPRNSPPLCALAAQVVAWCHEQGMLVSVENAASSPVWSGPVLKACQSLGFHKTTLHQCMFGSSHRKHSVLYHNFPQVRRLCLLCDDQHSHAPWDHCPDGPVSAYPSGLCKGLALSFADCFAAFGCVQHVVRLSARSAELDDITLSRAAQVASGKQPKGKRIPPLVPSRRGVVTLRGPGVSMPPTGVLDSYFTLPADLQSNPAMPGLPAGSKCLRSVLLGGGSELVREMVFSVPKTPEEFVLQACQARHPRHMLSGIPPELHSTVQTCASQSYASVARRRTEVLRKWTLRAQELQGSPDPDPPVGHCAQILQGKDLRLFDEMLNAAGHKDGDLAAHVRRGFDLMGPLPVSNVMPRKNTFATLTPAEVRESSAEVGKAIWNSCKATPVDEIAHEVHRLTLEEAQKGWLQGPLQEPPPAGSVLTRRFGVKQTSTKADGTVVDRVRPIDDYTESQVNLTNSSEESIDPHSIDVIASGICARILARPAASSPEDLFARTIDLRKAYKQLPISAASLPDAYLCVYDPVRKAPAVYRTLVLPFGARAAVQGFCRCSYAIWLIGVVLFLMHWTCFFDDFFLVSGRDESEHLHWVQHSLFTLLGWETSSDKDAGFSCLARVLGVVVSFSDIKAGLLSVSNTEHRKKDVAALIDKMVNTGLASAHEVAVLRGRLMFADNQVFGRRSKQCFLTLTRASARKKQVAVKGDLLHALLFLRDRVLLGEPRRIEAKVRKKLCIFTDASHEAEGGGLGGIMYDSAGQILEWFSEWLSGEDLVPFGSQDKEGIIYELELFAAIRGAEHLLRNTRHHDVVLFCDNEAALACLIGGRADGEVAAALLSKLIELEESHDICFWFEWVASQCNPADAPSRRDVRNLPSAARTRLRSLKP